MTAIPCPALDGREPLGFLAAIGTLRLLADHADPAATLHWSTTDASAVIDTTAADDSAALAAWLAGIIDGIGQGRVIPGAPQDLPPPGEAPDRIRLAPTALHHYVSNLAGDRITNHRWIASLVTDLAVDDKGRAAISLLAAPSGKQSMRTMLEKPLDLIRRSPGRLDEALQNWVRVPGCTGEYLDHRVLFDAADSPDGQPRERGVPGATWLALMAYPLLRTTSLDGRLPVTTGWRRTPAGPVFEWPLWRPPLTVEAVQVLLEHPAVHSQDLTASKAHAALGVFAIHRAQRRRVSGRNFAGVLAPAP
jgi:hypothetical protein